MSLCSLSKVSESMTLCEIALKNEHSFMIRSRTFSGRTPPNCNWQKLSHDNMAVMGLKVAHVEFQIFHVDQPPDVRAVDSRQFKLMKETYELHFLLLNQGP